MRILIPLLIICLLLAACGSSNSENNSYQPNTTDAGPKSNAATNHFHPIAAATSSSPFLTTSTANSDPYPPSGTLALSDPLRDNSRGYRWENFPSNSNGASCQFIGEAYYAIASQNAYRACHAPLQASNFTLEVQMQVIQGNCGGLVLRDTMGLVHAYAFQVCQNGSYQLYRFDGFSSGQMLQSGSSLAIHAGLSQSNVIATVADGSTFDLYINHQKIASANDSSYSQGQFGFSANENSEVVYTNARMWTL